MFALLCNGEGPNVGGLAVTDPDRVILTLRLGGAGRHVHLITGNVAVRFWGLSEQLLADRFRCGCSDDLDLRHSPRRVFQMDAGLRVGQLQFLHVVNDHGSIEGLLE